MESRNLTLDLTELWALGKEEKGDWRVKRMSIAFRGGNLVMTFRNNKLILFRD